VILKTCEAPGCCETFLAKRESARFHSAACRQRNRRAQGSATPVPDAPTATAAAPAANLTTLPTRSMDSVIGPSRSSLAAAYSGIVVPAHYRIPRYDYTLGPVVGDLCRAVGYAPDPEQQLALDIAFARSEVTGRSVAFELALIVCRQNMKTGLFKMLELGWLFVTDERLVVHSAHEFSTSSEAFRDLRDIIDASPMLAKRIPPNGIRTANGNQSIETTTGARLVFKTRTKTGGRGLSGRKIVLDEAFALQAEHMGALLPLVSAQPDPQIFYGSSACRPESAVLHGLVGRLRGTDDDPRLAGLEWCAPPPAEACERGDACDHRPSTPGCGCDKRELITLGNPQAGKRLGWETIEGERKALGPIPEEFGRERMGWHDAPADGRSPIDPDDWDACADTDTALASTTAPALGFDVKPDMTAAAIAVVGKLEDGRWRGELVKAESGKDGADFLPGTDWLVARLKEVTRRGTFSCLVLDAQGPAAAFIAELLAPDEDGTPSPFVRVANDEKEKPPKGKTRLVIITTPEYGQGCGALEDDIRNRRWRHFDQRPLNEAANGARTKALGDGLWKWSRKDSTVNIAPLVAVTLARHGFARYGGEKPKPRPFAVSV
jgi:hypothetical protein